MTDEAKLLKDLVLYDWALVDQKVIDAGYPLNKAIKWLRENEYLDD
jgi:hypothetical protein